MKTIFLLLTTFAVTGLFAQTRVIGGKFTKSDGTRMKPATTMVFVKGIDDNILITNYIGGSDNSASIEIEVPIGAYVTEFRNMINSGTASNQLVATKPKVAVATTIIKQDIGIKTSPSIQPLQPAALARAEITVVNINSGQSPQYQWVNTIILEDVKVESCTDNAATGTSKIKLKGNRIGWIYYAYDKQGSRSSTQSGWNAATGQAWNNF
ncbi:MAG: hypothetical protein V4560_12880 [Bacteroidota bacterium]